MDLLSRSNSMTSPSVISPLLFDRLPMTHMALLRLISNTLFGMIFSTHPITVTL